MELKAERQVVGLVNMDQLLFRDIKDERASRPKPRASPRAERSFKTLPNASTYTYGETNMKVEAKMQIDMAW